MICEECKQPAKQLLLLWNGYRYCPACLAGSHPDLPDYLRRHPTVVEKLPSQLPLYWRWHVGLALIVAFVLVTIYAGTASWNNPSELLVAVLAITLVAVAASFVRAVATQDFIKSCDASVSVHSGTLELRRHQTSDIVRLVDCPWRVGWSGELSMLSHHTFIPPFKLILIDVPLSGQGGTYTVGVGFTQESFALWKAFLTLARIRYSQL